MIDVYIDRLKAARDLLASLSSPSETSDRKTIKRKSRAKAQSIEVPIPPHGGSQVAVQIVPARVPRQQRRPQRPESQTFSALGRPVPAGPVVIRPADVDRMRRESSQAKPMVMAQQTVAPSDALEELAQEVAKRLGSGGSFHHRA